MIKWQTERRSMYTKIIVEQKEDGSITIYVDGQKESGVRISVDSKRKEMEIEMHNGDWGWVPAKLVPETTTN